MTPRRRIVVASPLVLQLTVAAALAAQSPARFDTVRVEAREGTWLAFDASRDGRLLAFDLLGQIWTLPAGGGEARAVTDAVRDTAEDTDPAFAPDGRSLVFAGERAGHAGLWQVDVATERVRRLTTPPDRDDQPAWAPDGARIAFVRGVSRVEGGRTIAFDGLHLLDLRDGAVRLVPVGDSGRADVRDPAWSPDGRTLYLVAARPELPAAPVGGPIWALDVASGHATLMGDSALAAFAPAPSPDGRRLAYIAADSAGRRQLWLRDLASGARRRVTDEPELTARRVRWTPDGAALLYVAGGRLRRIELATSRAADIPFVASLAFARRHVELPQRRFPAAGSRQPARGQLGLALSPDGRRFAVLALGRLWVAPVGGAPREVAAVPVDARDVEWAPAGDRVAYSVGSWGDEDVRVADLATGRTHALTAMPGREIVPRWSPDGRWIAFLHAPAPDSAARLLVLAADARDVTAPSAARDLGDADPGDWAVGLAAAAAPAWSPDSRALLVVHAPGGPIVREPFAVLRPATAELVPLDGPRRTVAGVPFQPTFVRWPNDTTLVFVSADRAWRSRLAPGGGTWGEPRPLGDDAALYLSAARDGALLYVSGDGLRLRDAAGAVRRLGWPLTYRAPEPAPLLLRNARVLDGTGAPPAAPRDLLLGGGRIARIAPPGAIPAAGARVLDAGGGIVMPGLADLHFHYDGPEQLRGLLYNGVTVVRDQGSDIATLAARADGSAAGTWPAPRISFGAFQLYTDWPFGNGLEQGLEPEQDAGHLARAVALLAAHGAEHMKIRTFHGWAVNVRLVEAAHRAGLRTTGHCVFPLALLAAGMDAKEHVGNTCGPRFNEPLREDVIQLLRNSGVFVDPTTIVYAWWRAWLDDRGLLRRPDIAPFLVAMKRDFRFWAAESDPGYWVRDQGRLMIEQTRALHRAGIPLGLGTDAPELPWAAHLELERLVEAGLTPLEAIRAGTETAARIMGHDAEAGTVAEGKLADLLVLEPGADPSRDIRDTRRIRYVILGGGVVDREALRRGVALRP
ncbi:MAG TPA: amidohydrolase family protein [Longimicrobiales bacterium]|nr:amidohydrolase family protein [Longimicrobiales bacterium]